MNVFDDDAQAPNADASEANEVRRTLLTCWKRIWDRPHTERSSHEYLDTYGPPQEPPVSWEPVTAQELFRAAKKQRGKAGGCDGWLGTELPCFPIQLWTDVAPFIQFCKRRGVFPSAFTQVHQVFLPKGGAQRQSDSATPVSKSRPISLLSTWWRTWSSARENGSIDICLPFRRERVGAEMRPAPSWKLQAAMHRATTWAPWT